MGRISNPLWPGFFLQGHQAFVQGADVDAGQGDMEIRKSL